MPTLNQLSTLNFQDNLVLNALNSPDKTQLVYDFSNGYNVLDQLMSIMNKKKATRVTGMNGLHSKPIMGKSRVVAQVASTSIVSSNLVIVFADPNYSNFRVKDSVIDSSANQTIGRVVATAKGTITLEPVERAWSTGTDFLAGSYALATWDASGNRGSGGKSSLYEQPTYINNQTAILRETTEIFRRDMFQTYPTFEGDFWWTAQDRLTVNRFARMQEYRDWFSKYKTITGSAVEGDVNFNGGLKWAITDPTRGGVYKPLTNQMSQGDFEDFIGQISDRKASTSNTIPLLMGRGALRQLQSFTSDFIKYGGKTNTFGGDSVKGLDVYEYTVSGTACKFMMAPILNDTDAFPQLSTISGISGTKMQNTIVALDDSDFDVVGGGTAPAMERIYFGEEEYIYGYVPGLIGNKGVDPSNVLQSGNMLATNDKDNVSLQLYTDSGIDVVAQRMGWMELLF